MADRGEFNIFHDIHIIWQKVHQEELSQLRLTKQVLVSSCHYDHKIWVKYSWRDTSLIKTVMKATAVGTIVSHVTLIKHDGSLQQEF